MNSNINKKVKIDNHVKNKKILLNITFYFLNANRNEIVSKYYKSYRFIKFNLLNAVLMLGNVLVGI